MVVNNCGYLNAFSGNFATYLKNFTPKEYYGVNVNGNLFCLYSEYPVQIAQAMRGVNPQGPGQMDGILVQSYDVEISSVNNITSRWYKSPCKNYPLYIEELNIVLFETREERDDKLRAYSDEPGKLVKAYATGMASVINASYTAITTLNTDTNFYMLGNGGINRLPPASEASIKDYLKRFNLEPDILKVNYVFIFNTIIRDTRNVTGSGRDTVVQTDIKMISKSKVIKGEPIIQDSSGIVLFDSRESSEQFLNTYGTLIKYLLKKTGDATDEKHNWEIEDINKQAKRDKRGMLEMFGIMGGTSVMSILTENVIKAYNSPGDNKDKISKSLKIFGIGFMAIASIVGIYKAGTYVRKTIREKKDLAKN
jgi:hypothetical protein